MDVFGPLIFGIKRAIVDSEIPDMLGDGQVFFKLYIEDGNEVLQLDVDMSISMRTPGTFLIPETIIATDLSETSASSFPSTHRKIVSISLALASAFLASLSCLTGVRSSANPTRVGTCCS